MSVESRIERVELYAVADDHADTLPWAADQEPLLHTNNIVRILCEDGTEGVGATISYTENNFDKCIIEAMKNIAPGLIGKNAVNTGAIHSWLANRCNWGGLVAKSPFDIACWDIKGRVANMPIYQMLGGCRDRMLSYASTPMFETIEEYISFIDDCINHGFRAIKMHCPCVFERDYKLVEAVQNHYGSSGIAFMLDTAMYYNQQDALKMAKRLEAYGWTWFEAPISDYDFKGYQRLVRETNIEISSHGNCLVTLPEVAYALANELWSDVRQDATVCGGITPLVKCFALAEAYGKTLEIQSWGYTITQAANLHVALAHNNCKYFEQAYPYENFEYGARNVIRTNRDGYVTVGDAPGLGVEMDWDKVSSGAIASYIIE